MTKPGVNPAFRAPPPPSTAETLRRLGIDKGGFFLSVGTMEPRKNHATLFAAYAMLPPEMRRRFPLVQVGQPGWGKVEPVHLDRLTAEGSVRILGYADEAMLHTLYSSARALLFPTLYEGFGMPVTEAMAAGLPVIASDIPVMREVAGGAADFVETLDAEGWAQAILEAAGTSDEGLDKRREAARRASETYTWEKTAQGTAAIYREFA